MDINDYMRKINYQPNSAHIPDYIKKRFEEEQRKEQLEKIKADKIVQMQKDVESQKSSQDSWHSTLKIWLRYNMNTIQLLKISAKS